MKRRDFIKSATALTIAGTQMPVMALGKPRHQRKVTGNWGSDRIVILIKLNGGNDGLNTLIPIKDSIYYEKRPLLAYKKQDSLPFRYDTNLHPALVNTQQLYQRGMMSAIHGVGYPAGNLSHFRSSDIWSTGSGAERVWRTGWLGRLFANDYPDYPANIPDHPIGIQMASANLLEFQSDETNMGMILGRDDSLYRIIDQNYVTGTIDPAPNSYGGEELKYVRSVDESTYQYSGVIQEASEKGRTTQEYPESFIGLQLAVAAKLISGGLTTPVYRTFHTGFDTHANQYNDHTNLLRQLDKAVYAFLKDMGQQGLLDKILVVTTSEFGRRVKENGSVGTDHGTAGPALFYGAPLRGEVIGHQPYLSDLNRAGNIATQHDYRQVYSTILSNWFGVSNDTVKQVFVEDYEPLPIIHEPLSVDEMTTVPAKFKLHPAFPNPFNPTAVIPFELPKASKVRVRVFDLNGRQVSSQNLGTKGPGHHEWPVVPKGWSSGTYIVQLEALGSVLNQQITYLK
ncbi:MAG: DUF1501 domain-containing protein [Candidatus Marinimicrobia bacterium]|jgi:uncharacterized protein (DUF1501 family)|nr:DUF1501 domain-containing protein [Candidatus Neomarinimicrobiota bacterium]